MPSFDRQVQRIIAAHGGVISRIELLGLGLSSSSIARQVSSGALTAVVPGVYRPATTTPSRELRLRATSLRLGTEATIAGRSAAWWHGLTRVDADPVIVFLPRRRGHSFWPGVRVIRTDLDPADRTTVRGLPVTTRARTVLDCAADIDAEEIRDAAFQRGTSIWSLDRALERFGSARGAVGARELVARARDGGVSPPERLALHALLHRSGERWTASLRIQLGPAEEYVIDLAIEDLRLGVEVDGWTVHSHAEAFHRDRDRQNVLVVAGWTVLRYTPRRLRHDVDGAVAEILAMAAILRSAPKPRLAATRFRARRSVGRAIRAGQLDRVADVAR